MNQRPILNSSKTWITDDQSSWLWETPALLHKPPARSKGDRDKSQLVLESRSEKWVPLRHAGHTDPCCDLWGTIQVWASWAGASLLHLPFALANLFPQHPLNKTPASPGPCLCLRHSQALQGSHFTLLKPCCLFFVNVFYVIECYLKNLQHSMRVKCEKMTTLFSERDLLHHIWNSTHQLFCSCRKTKKGCKVV